MLSRIAKRVCIVTGGANGIGAETVRLLVHNGAKVVIADTERARARAESLISSIRETKKEAAGTVCHAPLFKAVDILDWTRLTQIFRETEKELGAIQHVIANAGIMESSPTMDLDDVCGEGELNPPVEAHRVIDVNLKGTLNTLKLALHHMRKAGPIERSVVLVGSTSSYFGDSGVVAYVASKHGVLGLLRASQHIANEIGVRVNAVAPFFTPTGMTAGYRDSWASMNMKGNTPNDIATAIVQNLIDENQRGCCTMVVTGISRELEESRRRLLEEWVGTDIVHEMKEAKDFFAKLGGYPLPPIQVV